MQNHYTNVISPLDRIRIHSGNEKLKIYFSNTAQENRRRAIAWINHDGLLFATLYILLPEIDALNLYEDLRRRNRFALDLCSYILSNQKSAPDGKEQFSENDGFMHSVLKWMLLTGAKDDGLNNEFEQVLDISASLLIRIHQDTSVLPELVRMIFRRNQKGHYIHDLIWALFSSRDPRIFKWIAEYLRSPKKSDRELASKLLRYAPKEASNENIKTQRRYAPYISWLKENQPYLCFTGEDLHQTCDPVRYIVDLGSKYLCKRISAQDRNSLNILTEEEQNRLNEFDQMKDHEKFLLATYSNRLRGRNKNRWNRWIRYPIDKQIKIAHDGLGDTP